MEMETETSAHVSRFHRNLYSDMAILFARQQKVKNLEYQCRSQMNEMLLRTDTLNEYAQELVSMRKRIFSLENSFKSQYFSDSRSITRAHQKAANSLHEVRANNRAVSGKITSFIDISEKLTDLIGHMLKNYTELQSQNEQVKAKLAIQPPEIPLELWHSDIDDVKTKLMDTQEQILLYQQKLETGEDRRKQLLILKTELLKRIQKLSRERQKMVKTREARLKSFRETMLKVNHDLAKQHQREITFTGEKIARKNNLDSLTQRLSQIDSELNDFSIRISSNKKNQSNYQTQIAQVRAGKLKVDDQILELAQITPETEKRMYETETRKNKVMTNHRTISAELEQTKETMATTEDEKKRHCGIECHLQELLAQTETDLETAAKQAVSLDEACKEITEKLARDKREEKEYQGELDNHLMKLHNIKAKVEIKRKEEVSSQTDFSENEIRSKEIDEARHRVNVVNRGYEVQISQTKEQCRHLEYVFKFERMKYRLRTSGYQRACDYLRKVDPCLIEEERWYWNAVVEALGGTKN